MAIRLIREEGDEILKKKSKPVNKITDRIKELLGDMVETMDDNDGVGLAAVQVGVLRRMITVRLGEELYKLINPVILSEEGEAEAYEGCLSVPGRHMVVKRPQKVVLEALDENGEQVTIEAEGHLARAFCHEVDHLDGTLFLAKADYDQPVLYPKAEAESEEES